jgi:Transglycosylase SLT domain
MTAKSVIQIDVDDSKFREFNGLFQEYQKKLEEMPEDWKKVIDATEDGSESMEKFAGSAMSSKDFLVVAAIQADAISKAMARATGVQDKFNTKAKDGAIQMTRMQKASAAMHKSISGMSSVLLKLGTVGASGIGSAIAAVYGATNQLAGQNLQARGLGLKIGQTQAFDANFEKFGLGASDLGNVANAQSDPTKWRALIAAGLTPQQIQNEDAEQLTYDFARAASGKYRQWQKSGMPAGSMAQAYGFTDFLSQQQLRTGASYTDADWMRAQQKELADAKKNAVDQGVADQASDVKAGLKSDWAQVMNAFNDELAKSGPELKTLGDAAAAAAVSLIKIAGPQAKSLLDAMANGAPKTVLANGLHPTLNKPNDLGSGFAAIGYSIQDLFSGGKIGTPTDQLSAMLNAQLQTESSDGKHLLSPKGAKGPYQFMDDTWKDWGNGGNVNDPKASRDAAQRYDAYLLKRYSGDVRKALAAYNWGMGYLDRDINGYKDKNGVFHQGHGDNWEKFAPKETRDYINRNTSLMATQNVQITITNNTSANVATSMNAAPH